VEIDPSLVRTPAELAECLNRLRNRRGLSYEEMERRSRALRGRGLQLLGKSTVGEIVTGRSLPSIEKLRAFLVVCQVPATEVPGWRAAWERARSAQQAAPRGVTRVRDARHRDLGVHAAIQVDGQSGDLPSYVPRDIDGPLRDFLTTAAEQGGFVVLLGGSSVGKSRMLFEALLAIVPDWQLIHPDFGDPGQLRALAGSPAPRMVVWLDELQRYLTPGASLAAGDVRTLVHAGAILVGTMWPGEYTSRIAPSETGDDGSRPLLKLAQVFDVAGEFTTAEQQRAREAAKADERIRVAMSSPDGGLTQVLAAGPQLVRWWEQAPTPYASAVATAALDARRLGLHGPASRDMLATAAPGYLSVSQRARAPRDWLDQALAYATTLLHGATSALVPVGGAAMGRVDGYQVADYLLQHGRRIRREVCPPASFWEAMQQTDRADDLERLAGEAERRMRYHRAERLYRHADAAGGRIAGRELIELLVRQGRVDDAIAFLRTCTDPAPGWILIKHLLNEGDIDRAREAALALPEAARQTAEKLADGLLTQGRRDDVTHLLDLLPPAAAAQAALRLVVHLVREGLLDDALEAILANPGDEYRSGEDLVLTALLERGRTDDAIDFLQRRPDKGPFSGAADRLCVLLATEDRHGELRALSDAGSRTATRHLARVLTGSDRLDEAFELLRTRGDFGTSVENARLSEKLTAIGRVDDAAELLRSGATNSDMLHQARLIDLLTAHGRYDEAIGLLRTWALRGEKPAHDKLVRLLEKLSRTDQLTNYLWTRARKGNHNATNQLRRLLARQGRHEDLLQLNRDLAKTGDGEAINESARLLCERGAIDEALTVLQGRDSPGSRYQASKLLAELGRWDELRALADAGDSAARSQLATRLVQLDQLEERAEKGDRIAADRLARRLAELGREDDLRRVADAGNDAAAEQFARSLADGGRIDELRERADGGDRRAAMRLADELVRLDQRDELRRRSTSGDMVACGRLAYLLRREGRTGDEIEVLREHQQHGPVAKRLADLLKEDGRIDEAIAVLEPHMGATSWPADFSLMILLQRRADVERLRKLAGTGYSPALSALAHACARTSRVDEAVELWRDLAARAEFGAEEHLAQLLAEHDRLDDLRREVDAGNRYAVKHADGRIAVDDD
jgi:transcriptional regulator with XRE-family HTH domain